MRVTSKTYFISGGHNFESHRALAKELDKLGGSMSDGIGVVIKGLLSRFG
jgi:hypothetical protein